MQRLPSSLFFLFHPCRLLFQPIQPGTRTGGDPLAGVSACSFVYKAGRGPLSEAIAEAVVGAPGELRWQYQSLPLCVSLRHNEGILSVLWRRNMMAGYGDKLGSPSSVNRVVAVTQCVPLWLGSGSTLSGQDMEVDEDLTCVGWWWRNTRLGSC